MLLNKPKSMTIREWLPKVLSQREHIPVNIINAVVNHQWDGASSALSENNSVEISGFGKFTYNARRAETEMRKLLSNQKATLLVLEEHDIAQEKKRRYELRLKRINDNIELLRTKL